MTTTDTLTGTAGDPFAQCLALVRAGLDAAAGAGAWGLSEKELRGRLAEAVGLGSRFEELKCRLLADALDRGLPAGDGCPTAVSWVCAAFATSGAEAKRLTEAAGLLAQGAAGMDGPGSTRLTPTRQSWARGDVSREQAVLIGQAAAKISPQADEARVHAVQVELAGLAHELSYRNLRIACNRAFEVVDPDAADALLARRLQADEERALEETTLRFYRKRSGLTGFTGAIPDTAYQMLQNALDAHTSPRRRSRLDGDAGLAPSGPRLDDGAGRLSSEQKQGRALLELIEHLDPDRLPQHGGVNATLVITMNLDQIKDQLGAATLADGTEVSPGEARRLACGAKIAPAVLGAASQVLDLGRTSRLFTPGQRLALETRDKGCVFPGCQRLPGWCESHHVDPWSKGGGTDVSRGALLCSFHHRLIHSLQGWAIHIAPDGIPEILPPTRIDPTHTPRRHERFTPPMRT